MRRGNPIGYGNGALADPGGVHPSEQRTLHVFARGIADKEDVGGVKVKHLKHLLVDTLIRLTQADFSRDDHGFKEIGDAAIEEDLAAALGIVEVGKEAHPIVTSEAADRFGALGGRPSDGADAVHVNAGQFLGELAQFDSVANVMGSVIALKNAGEAVGTSNLDPVGLALGVNFVDGRGANLDKVILKEPVAEPLGEFWENERHRGADAASINFHQWQPLGLPFNEGIEEVEDDRFVGVFRHRWGVYSGMTGDGGRSRRERDQIEDDNGAVEANG